MIVSPVQCEVNFYLETSQMAEVSNEVYCGTPETVQKEKDKAAKAKSRGRMFIKDRLPVCAQQVELIKALHRPEFHKKSTSEAIARVAAHLLNCVHDRQDRKGQENKPHQEVPISDMWLEKFGLQEAMRDLVKIGVVKKIEHINRGGFGKGKCCRFKFSHKFKNEFDRLSIEDAVCESPSKIVDLVAAISPLYSSPVDEATEVQNFTDVPLRVNLINAYAYLKEQQAALALIQGRKKKRTAQLRLLHNIRCLNKISASVLSTMYKGIIHLYMPKYINIDTGERVYEIGGGSQGISKDFKLALLKDTDQTVVDMSSAHANIAMHAHIHYDGFSPLTTLLTNGYGTSLGLLEEDMKIIYLAIINGASTRLSSKHSHKLTILNVIRKRNPQANSQQIQAIITDLLPKILPLADSTRRLQKRLTKQGKGRGRGTLSHEYQRIEQEMIANLRSQGLQICANEHDGWIEYTHQSTDNKPKGVLNITSSVLPNLTLNLTRKRFPEC
jgi:hypothetical protein